MITRKEIELMAPAGSWESLRAALDAGADSIYFGAGGLNMRNGSSTNFSPDDIGRIAALARKKKAKSYLTLNTIIYDGDIPAMREAIDRAAAEGVDAVIVADQSAMEYAREKGVNVHISTQLNISNTGSVRFYSRWADVMVLARELELGQIAAIHRNIGQQGILGPSGRPVRIEMFAHGALCMAVSGRCYLSLHRDGHSANRGECRQICRRSYELRDRETDEVIVASGQHLLSPKDLCTVGFLDRFIAAGVRVLKLEGRARAPEYVGRVCRVYNEALTALCEGSYTPERVALWEKSLGEVFNRGFWGGYYLGGEGGPPVELSAAYGSSATRRKEYVGKVTNFYHRHGVAEITSEASELATGDDYLILGETTGLVEGRAEELRVDDSPVPASRRGEPFSLKTPSTVRRGDKLYKLSRAQ